MDLIGRMRYVVYFCLNAPTAKGAGFQDNYGALVQTRGDLRKSSGSRSNVFNEIEADSSYTLWVRRQIAILNNITVAAKFVIDNVWYTVTSWEEVDHLYIKIQVNKKEPVQAGTIDLDTITQPGITPLYLATTVGQYSVSDATLENAEVLLVARSGTIYNKTTGTPGNLEFAHVGNSIVFSSSVTFNANEIVYVLCRTV